MEALSKEIKTFFDAAVTIDYDGPSNKHPIIVLNALKNIIGDNREKRSKLLLDSMKKLIDKYPKSSFQSEAEKMYVESLNLLTKFAEQKK